MFAPRQGFFPPTIDSTMLAAWRSCQHKMFRMYMEHWKPQTESVHLVAGGAFAKGLEVTRKTFFVDGRPADESIAMGVDALIKAYGDFQCPPDSAKSLERTAGALDYYFEAFPLGSCGANPTKLPSGAHAIEFSFAEPLPIQHPTLNQPILYTGRADMICDFGGALYTEDDKTTSSLGASWPRQWEMRSQFTGYTWAARKTGLDIQGTLVRGVSILKTKYDHAQHVTYRSPAEIDRWYTQLLRDVRAMVTAWEEGYYNFNFDHSCAEYGGCSLVNICKANNPEEWLPIYFEKRVWDPLARKECTVDEWEQSWGHNPNGLQDSIPAV